MCRLICLGGVSAGSREGRFGHRLPRRMGKSLGKTAAGAIYPQCRLDCQDESQNLSACRRRIIVGRIEIRHRTITVIWAYCTIYGGSGASYMAFTACSSHLAYDGSSGSLASNFSDVRVAPVLPMVITETVVVLLTACADLRFVSEERQLSQIRPILPEALPYAARLHVDGPTSQPSGRSAANSHCPAARGVQPCSMPIDTPTCFALPPRRCA